MSADRSQPTTTKAAADSFNLQAAVKGCTFDDVLFSPKFGVLERRDPSRIDLSCPLTAGITLARPFLSANMDTVTRAPMAILLAEEGGIGVIDRGFRNGDIVPQIREVEIVKRTQHGIIPDPYTIAQSATLAEAVAFMRGSDVGTLVVVDGQRRLRGLLTERDARFVTGSDERVADRMTPLDALVVRKGPISLDVAEQVMVERKIKKLPLVDDDGVLTGLVTAKDILKQRRLPFATRDAQGRLRVAAAIGATGDYVERAVELDRAGADALVIDIAHGHSVVMERALTAVRQRLPNAQLIAGNVATGDGALFLADQGADGVKVGIGPGGGCTTRMTTSFGVPQLQALVDCGEALAGQRVDQASEYNVSVHGQRLAEGDQKVATCISCHGAHGIRQVSDAGSPVFPLSVAATCARCHSDPEYMADYTVAGEAFPTGQQGDYERSVHHNALSVNNDLSAPTCNDCHGNHGAAPPGVGSIVNVCGTCHAVFAQRFEPTTHAFIFERGCVECHDNHAVQRPSDAMIGADEAALCTTCHSEGDAGLAAAVAIRGAIETLKRRLDETETLVGRAINAGMEMSDQEIALGEVRNHVTLARTELHAFDPATVDTVVADGLELLEAVDAAGRAALDDLRFRRRGLAVSLALILFFVAALGLKIRQLDRRVGLRPRA